MTAAVANATPPPKWPGQARPASAVPAEEMVSQLMIKPRFGAKLASALQKSDASTLASAAAVPLSVARPMSGGAHVLRLAKPVPLSEARVIAARLMGDADVEYVEPDQMMRPLATPTDPEYGKQWHYYAPAAANLGGANLPAAWDLTTGGAQVTVAVIDTGVLPHADLTPLLQGYNFISDPLGVHDGLVRNPDGTDTGDWVAADECGFGSDAQDSGWHGTHVAGTIAARMNNGKGGVGVAPTVQILPVRVLGRCGGTVSDIVDGMRWAAGVSVPGVPNNPNPAKVLNMSLGGSNACGPTYQAAVDDVLAAGSVIVAATGNNGSATVGRPANCNGVIAVTAHAIDGDNTDYAQIGSETAISAPGGGCGYLASSNAACSTFVTPNGPGVYSTLNSGKTMPAADSYANYQGTSMATPHVAGVVALMFSLKPDLTPGEVKTYLQNSARPHPAGTTCTLGTNPGKCGAGLLDAAATLAALPGVPPVVTLTVDASRVVKPNASVALTGTATAAAGRTIASYLWAQASGDSVGAIANANTANASFTAPPTGTVSFTLTATDSDGQSGSATATVRVNSAPVLKPVAPQSGVVGSTISFKIEAVDTDGDAPIFHSVDLPSGATLSAAGEFNWSNAGPVGTYTVTYYASDNDANSENGSATITITAPSGGGGSGGGGSLDGSVLLALASLAAVLRLRRGIAGRTS
ncbi:MAG: S8 family serine peptidase [Burkholderiaceae bacterium]